jgi:hypothetical protein
LKIKRSQLRQSFLYLAEDLQKVQDLKYHPEEHAYIVVDVPCFIHLADVVADSPAFAGLLSLFKVFSMRLSKGRFTLGFWTLRGAP